MHRKAHQAKDLRAAWLWRFGINIGLVICAAAFLFTRPFLIKAIREEVLAKEWLLVGPIIFLLLFLTFIVWEFFSRKNFFSMFDYIKALFGVLVVILSFPSSLREYQVRKAANPVGIEFVTSYAANKDARIRALAILASSRHKFHEPAIGALIRQALLDKDPLVQQAAKLVIEDNFGIRLKNGVDGINQVNLLIKNEDLPASFIRKGSP
jgi:hypothetical protein